MNLVEFAQKTSTTPAKFRAELEKHGVTVSHQAVMLWFQGKRQPAPKHLPAIEAASGGKVKRHHQRPDIYGPRRKAA